jgi:hypothetical protein
MAIVPRADQLRSTDFSPLLSPAGLLRNGLKSVLRLFVEEGVRFFVPKERRVGDVDRLGQFAL